MSDEHPDYSPFAYCYNNPIKLIDPLGLDTIVPQAQGKGIGVYLPDNATNLRFSSSNTGTGTISGRKYDINEGGLLGFAMGDQTYKAHFDPGTGLFVGYKDQQNKLYDQLQHLPSAVLAMYYSPLSFLPFWRDPDLITIDIGLSTTAIAGAEKSWVLNILLSGPEKGAFFTQYEASSWGAEIDWGGAVSYMYYNGNPSTLKKSDVLGRLEKASGSMGPVSLQYNWCRSQTNKRKWQGFSIGGGFGIGGSYRDGQTF